MKAVAFAALAAWMSGASLARAVPLQDSSQDLSVSAPASRQLEDTGFEHFYSLEYDEAIATFQKLRDAEPDNPAWRNDLAAAYFYRQLLIAGVMQGDLFAGSNRFFSKKIQPDSTFEKNFREANQAAIALCEQRLKQNGKNQEALYDCGVAYADRAAYQGLVEHAKLETLASASKAAEYHVRLARLNPYRYDAYLVPGLYEYVLGSLPGSLKFLLFFAGFTGDKERGLHAVESTAQSGTRSKQDAKILLAVMYRREKQYDDARRTLAELAQAYPRNYVFPLEIASIHRSAGQEKEAIRIYEQVLNDIRNGKPGYSRAPLARIHYELGELYWKAGNLESAKNHLEQVNGSLGSNQELEIQNGAMRRQVEEALHDHQPEDGIPRRCCAAP